MSIISSQTHFQQLNKAKKDGKYIKEGKIKRIVLVGRLATLQVISLDLAVPRRTKSLHCDIRGQTMKFANLL